MAASTSKRAASLASDLPTTPPNDIRPNGWATAAFDLFLGPLTFQSPTSLRVAGQTLAFERALLAPRADRARSTIPGADTLDYRTPDDLAELAEWPRHWAMVGSSSTACELARTLALLGSTVDLVVDARLMSDVDLRIAEPPMRRGESPESRTSAAPAPSEPIERLVAAGLEAEGVRVWRDQTIVSANRTGAAKSLLIERQGKSQWIVADELLIVTHRTYDIEWLRPELAGVAMIDGEPLTDRSFGAAHGRMAVIPAAELPELGEGDRLLALARRAARAGLGLRERWPPPPVARRLRIAPGVGWVGDCGPRRAAMIDRHVSSSDGAYSFGGELRLRVNARSGQLVGAMVSGPAAETLLPVLEQLILDGPSGPRRLARQARWEWLARLVIETAEHDSGGGSSLVAAWRRWRRGRSLGRD